MPDVVELVAEQRPGRVVAVLTNATSRLADHLDVLGLHAWVDAVFSSAELGVAKPDPAPSRPCAARLASNHGSAP